MTVPPVQRAARVHGPRDLRIDAVPVPVPNAHEVLVRVLRVGLCGSDVHFYDEGRIGPTLITEPLTMGHEPSGIVESVGSAVTTLRPGDRVSVEPGVPCGRCATCRAGHYNLCPDIEFFAFPPTGGALTEFVAIHEDFAHRVPDEVSDDEAALIEPLAVALWAHRRVTLHAGMAVTVTGAGPIGLLCAQLARIAGARVTVSDPRAGALEMAQRFGAHDVVQTGVDSLPPADVLMECSGHPQAILDGVSSLTRRGVAVLVGIGPDPVALPSTALRRLELTVTSSFRYAGIYPVAIDLVARRLVDVAALITDRYDLADVPRAFEHAIDQTGANQTIKAIVDVADIASRS